MGDKTQPENDSIQTFLTELASAAPTPGGGGAAAISGAMGAALVSMVCNLTIGKKKYVEVEAELKDVLARSEGLRAGLTGMIAQDVAAFDAVMGAYGLPKGTDEEKDARNTAIQAALKEACDVPWCSRPMPACAARRSTSTSTPRAWTTGTSRRSAWTNWSRSSPRPGLCRRRCTRW